MEKKLDGEGWQTPSFTKSPSTCGGKCFVGSLSHSRICSLRSFARARITRVDITMQFGTSRVMIKGFLPSRPLIDPVVDSFIPELSILWLHRILGFVREIQHL